MSKNLAAGFILISILLVNGCASHTSGTTVKQSVERDGVSVVLPRATYKEVYFSPSSSMERHCRAPELDFTVQQCDQLSIALPVDGVENIGTAENQAALSLGGPSPTALITRELMYWRVS
ncbi:MAG: hypothetical protein ACJAUP_001821 [Cellvibrionaceae bacterium]|jgi:hypothetical protein